MIGKYHKGRQNMTDSLLWETKRGGGKGGGRGVGVTGEGHWGGRLMGWALGVILYFGKLNTNKNKFII